MSESGEVARKPPHAALKERPEPIASHISKQEESPAKLADAGKKEDKEGPHEVSDRSMQVNGVTETQEISDRIPPIEKSLEDIPTSPQEILSKLPEPVQKTLTVLFDSFDALDTLKADDITMPSSAREARTMLHDAIFNLRFAKDTSQFSHLIKKLQQTQIQYDKYKLKRQLEQDTDKRQLEDEKAHIAASIHDIQPNPSKLVLERNRLQIQLDAENTQWKILRVFRKSYKESLQRRLEIINEALRQMGEAENSFRMRDYTRSDELNIELRETHDDTKNNLIDNLGIEAIRKTAEQLHSLSESSSSQLILTRLYEMEEPLRLAINEGVIRPAEISEFTDLMTRALIKKGSNYDQQVTDGALREFLIRSGNNHIFRELQGRILQDSKNLIHINTLLKNNMLKYSIDIIKQAINTANLNDQQRTKLSEILERYLPQVEANEFSKNDTLETWKILRTQSGLSAIIPEEILQSMDEFFGISFPLEKQKVRNELNEALEQQNNLAKRTLAVITLKYQNNGEALQQLYNSDDPEIRELSGRALIMLAEKNDQKYIKFVMNSIGINPDMQTRLIKALFPSLNSTEYLYPIILMLQANPTLTETFLEHKSSINILHFLTLAAKRANYMQIGRSLTKLVTDEIPSSDALFDFVTGTELWPSRWPFTYTISEINGLDSHLQWKNLQPERRMSLLDPKLDITKQTQLVNQDTISSEYISKEYALLLIRNTLKHVIGDSNNPEKKKIANQRNRELISIRQQPLIPGTLLHGTNIDALSFVLHGGDRAGEFLGFDRKEDQTMFSADFSEVIEEDNSILPKTLKQTNLQIAEELKQTNDFARIYYQSIAAGYGAKPDIARGIAADTKSEEDTGITLIFDRSGNNAFLKGMGHQGFMRKQHKLILVGLPATEISGVIVNSKAINTLERAKKEFVENGFYIPIYNVDGNLLFSPEEYDKRREDIV